jgi:DNA-directed RNA polymerase specialized sigma24 family protein
LEDSPQALWKLFHAVAATDGDREWKTLLVELEPELMLMARNQPIGRLRDREDSPREIVTRVVARLFARQFTAVKKLCSLDPPPELRAWLRVLVRRSAIDYMREHPEFDRGNAERAPRWISLASLGSGEAVAIDPSSLAQKREPVLAFIRHVVDEAVGAFKAEGEDALFRLALEWKVTRIHVRRVVTRGEQYVTVLTHVLEGMSYPETATKLGITRREVELTVRYIEELLRARRFGMDPSDDT